MNRKSGTSKASADRLGSPQDPANLFGWEKIRIVLAGLRGEESISALCRREGISESLYYCWSKEFLEAGKRRLSGDTAPQATSSGAAIRGDGFERMRRRSDPGKPSAQKKHGRGWGAQRMRYPASEKLEIIRTVEGHSATSRGTCWAFRAPHSTDGMTATSDGFDAGGSFRKSVWNRIPQARRDDLIEFALD